VRRSHRLLPSSAGTTKTRFTEGLLWTNLNPSEQARLEELIDTVYDMSGSLEAQVVDATVHAALTFAAEYPNARRANLSGLVHG
jgi:hypothetical protein